ncbi:MAG: LCP family protein [Actinomycetota bacterium]
MTRPGRTWRQRLAIIGLTTTSIVLLAGAGVLGYVASVLSRIDRVEVAGLDGNEEGQGGDEVTAEELITGGGAGDDGDPIGPAGPAQNFLIVGSDDVSGVDADDAILTDREDEAGQSLADTIMLLRVEPSDGSASLLSIPRDLWVEIVDDDGNFEAKINAAFNLDDEDARAERLIETVKLNLDVPIQHYVHVNWNGFRELVDIVGGVEVCFERPQRDVETGFLIEDVGFVELGGDEALAYVRSRSMQEQGDDGRWRTLGNASDLDRITRQQDFLRLVIDQTDDLRNVGSIRSAQRLVESGVSNIEIDDTLAIGEIVDLVRRYGAFGGDDLRTLSLSVVDVRRGEQDTLDLDGSVANDLALDIFRGIEPDDVVPSRVAVTVSGPDSAEVAEELEELRFVASATGGSGAGSAESVLVYGPGEEQAALLLAAALGTEVRYENEQTATSGIELLLGTDEVDVLPAIGRRPEAVPPAATAPTTIAPAPTTTAVPPTTTTTEPSICAA